MPFKNFIFSRLNLCNDTFEIKTSQIIYNLYAIKSLTDNIELISMTHKYGHGISNTILQELDTENALLQ